MTRWMQRAKGRYERWRADVQHRFRTRLATRDRLFAASTLGLIAVATAALLVRGSLTVAAAVAALAGVALVRAAMLRPAAPPHAHGLPGWAEPEACPAPAPPDRSPYVLATRWLGAGLAVAVALAPVVVAWAIVAALAGAASPVIVDKARLWRTRRALRAALDRYQPRFVLGYGGYGGGPIHVGMWEPHLLASGDPGVIVGLRGHYCAELRAAIDPAMPWISAGSDVLGDMRVLTPPTVTTFFYVHNAPGHLKLMGIRSVRHVWLGHGDSDKAGSYHDRHRRYDVLVASGQAAVDRYARHGVDIPAERFVLLGRPQSSEVLPGVAAVTQVERPTVLYAPTWVGNPSQVNFSSMRVAEPLLRGLIAAGADVIFRPHPVFCRDPYWSGRLVELNEILRADHDDPATPGQHAWGDVAVSQWSVADCMNRADALVSDVSSVVSDWLASGKPYLMVAMANDLADFAEAVPVAAGAYAVDRDLTGLADVLEEMLRRDPLAERRRQLKVHVLGDYEGDQSARAFAAWVHTMAHTAGQRVR